MLKEKTVSDPRGLQSAVTQHMVLVLHGGIVGSVRCGGTEERPRNMQVCPNLTK